MRFPAALMAFLMALSIAVAPASAQDAAPATDEPAAAEESAAPPTAPAEEAPAEEAPTYPAGLDDPSIPLDELQVRIIPLTIDELTALAEAWQGVVKQQTEDVVDAQVALMESGDGEAAGEARTGLTDLIAERNQAFDRFGAVVTGLERKGGDQAAVDKYRAYRNAVLVEEQQRADWRTLAQQAMNWSVDPEGGLKLVIRITVVVVALLALMTVAGIFRRIARKWLSRVPNLSKLLQAFIAMIVYWIVIAIGLMIVLSALGVDITPLFAVVGGASFIMAFALQDTLGNLAAGLMIMINRPFDEGDYVTVAGTGGTVQKVSIVSTTVTTPDNQIIVIPNGKVWGDVITNVTASDTRRVDMVFGVGYDDDLGKAQEVLETTVKNHPLILHDPEPVIRVNELADSSVNFVVRPWTRREDYWTVYWDLMRQVKTNFDAAGISIPFPQTDLHVRLPEAAMGKAAALAGPSTGIGRPKGAPGYAEGDEGAQDAGEDDT